MIVIKMKAHVLKIKKNLVQGVNDKVLQVHDLNFIFPI